MTPRSHPRGFTLVELLTTLVVVSILGSGAAALIARGSEVSTTSRTQRDAASGVAHALHRVGVIIRSGATLATIDAASFTMSDGSGVAFDASTLTVTDDQGTQGALCAGVSAFELTYYDDTGTALDPSSAAPSDVVRVHVRVVHQGLEVRVACAVRAVFDWRAPV